MSAKPIHINVIDKNHKQDLNAEDYEKITRMNLRRYMNEKDDLDTGVQFISTKSTLMSFKLKLLRVLQSFLKRERNFEKQFDVFQNSMRYCLISGQWLGLFPISNVTEKDLQKMRYNIFSWRYLLCFIILLAQMMALFLSFYRLVTVKFSLTFSAYVLFYMSNCITSVLFMRLATKWHYLMKRVATSELNEYLGSYVEFKCNFATFAVMSCAFIEYVLSVIWQYVKVYDEGSDDIDPYEQLTITGHPWIFDLNIPYSLGIGIFLQILYVITTMIWSYSHLFIICVSLYLTSIFEQLNKKIMSCEGQYLPASYWRALREDYNRAARLVHSFDDVINSIVFISFASNLLFVCSQLYYILALTVMAGSTDGRKSPQRPNGLLYGYENMIYFTFSTIFVLSRSFAVSFIAAKIHSSSLVAAPSLYNVPSSSYCIEVQRFIEQINSDMVALTGLNFFYVTKELIITVIGTIATYELVLLQFNREERMENP